MARPLKQIDQDEFEKLCKMLCTEAEICAWFDVTDKTLSSWCQRTYGTGFSETYKKFRDFGKIAVRRAQLKLAEKSAAMAIFLGKQYLGQRDTPMEITHTVSPVDQITAEIFRVQQEQRAVEAEAAAAEEDDE